MSFNKVTLNTVDVSHKRVLMRVDFNVSLNDERVSNSHRIAASMPSIKYCVENGAQSVVLISHLGRPGGKRKEELTLAPIACELTNMMGKPVVFLHDCTGKEVEDKCAAPSVGSVILLENLRFHIEEEGQGFDFDGKRVIAEDVDVAAFRQSLSKLGDIYVNDAFGECHRAHSSLVGIDIPQKVAGFQLKKEMKFFEKTPLSHPKSPFLAIIGGADIQSKIPLIRCMLKRANEIILCGVMAYSFLKKACGMRIGDTPYDEEGAKAVPELMSIAVRNKVRMHLPVDFEYGDKKSNESDTDTTNVDSGIPEGNIGLDIGPNTIELFTGIVRRVKFIVWGGTPGAFEINRFALGTKALMDDIVAASSKGVTTIVCGGDTAAACVKFETEDRFSHICTGVGPLVELFEERELPGVNALTDA